MEPLIVPACYLPPVSYFSLIQGHAGPVYIDGFEHFVKQSYRSRATIATANGPLDLLLPVEHQHRGHLPMSEVKISYEMDWQRLHWMSLQTAYRRSAYFEYYEDDFAVFYEKKHTYLMEFNQALTELLLKRLKISKVLLPTESYQNEKADALDARHLLSPKHKLSADKFPAYTQVFEERTGFIPNLSIVDLLFNQGPQSLSYLSKAR